MIAFLIFLVLIKEGFTLCNQCSAFNVMCVSSNQYQYCISSSGAALGQPYTCPRGFVCSVLLANTSVPCIAGPRPDCTCGVCNNFGYTCVSERELRLCFDGRNPSGPVIPCPSGFTCDYLSNSGSFCALDGESTCSNTDFSVVSSTLTSTTVRNTTNRPMCSGPARYPMPNTNCTSYYLCVYNLVSWEPVRYNCTSGSLYNPSTQRCSRDYKCTE